MASLLDVLVVDDDPFILELLLDVIAEAGYSVLGVASAAEAMRVLLHTAPRLLITDLRMPGMAGDELVRYARAVGLSSLPIIVTSAHMPHRESVIPGATVFLAKPFELEELLALVQQMLA
jgi:CheY-like chemotaxis protein